MAKSGVQFTKDNEYYTPKEFVDKFGKFDYDPAKTKFAIYAIRWQLSGLTLGPCLALGLYLGWGIAWSTIFANAVGSCCFFFLDRWIFKKDV